MILFGDNLAVLQSIKSNSIDSVVSDVPYGLSFMGKSWDYYVPSIEVNREVLRVLKPGGHFLSFGGSCTYHRVVINIEDAGFEIRDQIDWIYGSGFPKSRNIGKDVDKMQGNYRKGESEWEGFGTGLKPAHEPICVARKPIEKGLTIAKNVLKFGTGALNIDDCRIPLEGDFKSKANGRPSQTGLADNYQSETANISDTKGRFPANIIHDGSGEVVKHFPHQKSGAMKKTYKYQNNGSAYRKPAGTTNHICEANEGSAARFFYCAKASASERNEGLEGFKVKRPDHRTKSGMGAFDEKGVQSQKNFHPTVKPIALMQYLVRLVTRQEGKRKDAFI